MVIPSSGNDLIYEEKKEQIHLKMGYMFYDKDLMIRAITHRDKFEKAQGVGKSVKDPLATLGDSAIKTLVLKRLVDLNKTAGDITLECVSFTSREEQSKKAGKAHLEDLIIWSANEIRNEAWKKRIPLGECLEMLIGAIYVDSGSIEMCEKSLEKIDFFKYDI